MGSKSILAMPSNYRSRSLESRSCDSHQNVIAYPRAIRRRCSTGTLPRLYGDHLCNLCILFDLKIPSDLTAEAERKILKRYNSGTVTVELYHHEQWQDLIESTGRGCSLCSLLLHEFQIHLRLLSTAQCLDCLENLQESQLILKIAWDKDGKISDERIMTYWRSAKDRFMLPTYFELYTPADDPLPRQPSVSGLQIEVHSGILFPLMKNWLGDCVRHHELCSNIEIQNTSSIFHPSRLIDVSPLNTSGDVRLVKGNDCQGSYVTLSHCWGKLGVSVQTNQRNEIQHFSCINFKGLPKSFQDAIIITRALGAQYLWIDALCIIQDSPTDWACEAGRMASIYKFGLVTLAACNAEDGTVGLLNSRRTALSCRLNAEPGNVFIRTNRDVTQVIEPKDCYQSHEIKSCIGFDPPYYMPLLQRAWTMQEAMLSSRVLYFADQLRWVCHTVKMTEDSVRVQQVKASSRSISASLISLRQSSEHLKLWRFTISQYSRRLLTYRRDKLNALGGIALEFQGVLKSEYLAGIWLDDLHAGLTWKTEQGPQLDKTDENYYGPSWSWISLEAVISYKQLSELESRMLHDQDLILTGRTIIPIQAANPFGEVGTARLEVRGFCGSVTFLSQTHLDTGVGRHCASPTVQGWDPTRCFQDTYFDAAFREFKSGQFMLVQVSAWEKSDFYYDKDTDQDVKFMKPYVAYLLLEPDESGGENCYRRAGVVWTDYWDEESEGWEWRDLLLI